MIQIIQNLLFIFIIFYINNTSYSFNNTQDNSKDHTDNVVLQEPILNAKFNA